MDPANGNDEHISAIAAAVMKEKTQDTMKLVQYARLPPAAIPVLNVVLTPPTK